MQDFGQNFVLKLVFEAVGNISPKLRTKAYFAPYVPENEQIAEMSKEETDKVIGLTKGIIFYLNDENIVEGIVLWNLFNRLSIARQVIAAERTIRRFNRNCEAFWSLC
ncbi:hypothetical protein O3M35_010802 [Rhynocoris fuscipes]|uniref:Mitochondrial apoptosis-inducing factor C-terminal domain-containing protein n=1 Tax=Rhynocoris fuscipes TaxID=488301 RepID=A0AAW1D827_9HEMI